jgi:hypothetical protein
MSMPTVTHRTGELILFYKGSYDERRLVDVVLVKQDIDLVAQAQAFAAERGAAHTLDFVEHLIAAGLVEGLAYDSIDCGDDGFDAETLAEDLSDRCW